MRVLLLGLVLWITACGEKVIEPPRVDTSRMEGAVARLIESKYRALLDAPESAEAWGRYGIALHAHNLCEPAQVCYDRARVLDPASFAYPYLQAFAREQRGEGIEGTLELLEAAQAIEPTYPPLYLSKGDAFARAGLLEEARDAYEVALTRDPNYTKAHANLGAVLIQLGDAEGARRHLERAASEFPDDRSVNAALARALALTGDPDRARVLAERTPRLGNKISDGDSMFDEVRKIDRSADACFQRAKMLATQGRWEEAAANLRITLEVRKDDSAVHSRIGQALMNLGRPSEARPFLERTLELKPEHHTARLRLARVHAIEGRKQEAKTELDAVLRAEPMMPDALTLRGLMHLEDKELGAADQAFRMALRAGHGLGGDAHLLWGNALAESRRYREAIEQFKAFIAMQPKRADARYALGLAYERNGQRFEAMREYEIAVGLDPRHPLAGRLDALRQGR